MKKGIVLLLFAMLLSVAASAQGRKALRINEVMIENGNSIIDEYGNRSGWIELHNSSRASMNIASVFITTEKVAEGQQIDRSKAYCIPRGDKNTKLSPLGYTVFYADGQPNNGTFHINFELNPAEDVYLALYDANGITKIDEVTIPAGSIVPNQSYARDDNGNWEVRDNSSKATAITPGVANEIVEGNSKIQQFKDNDPHGFILTILAMCIVFSALILLSTCFYFFGKVNAYFAKRNKAVAQGQDVETVDVSSVEHDSGEAIAAIALALHQHLNAHDVEDTVLTINKVKRAYSPWSSKIYSLREIPRR